jgi:hypothetical protein
MDGIVIPVTMSILLYTFFPFGVEMMMDVGRFSFPLTALRARGVFPSSHLSLPFSLMLGCFSSWSLPSLMIQIGLKFFSSSHGPASSACACRV